MARQAARRSNAADYAVLIISENSEDKNKFRRVLTSGFDMADDLEAGIRRLEGNEYDIVLLDPNLSGTGAADAIQTVVSTARPAPVVVIADRHDRRLETKALRLGAQDYILRSETDTLQLPLLFRRAIERQVLVTQLDEARRRAEHLATHCPLTGLPTRPLLQDRAWQAIAYAKRYDQMVGLLFMDLDGFKSVNDRFGHAAGDRLLQSVARRLSGSIRRSDTVARFGGDEFVILAARIESPDGARRLAEVVIERLGSPFTVRGRKVRISTSVGIALYPIHGTKVDLLLRKADQAMYLAKEQGPGHHCTHPVKVRYRPEPAPNRRRRDRDVSSGATS